jgi:type I restriction enzyme R subunit
MTASERKSFTETVGIPVGNLAEKLLDAFDEDVITAKAQAQFDCATPTPEQYAQVQKEAVTEAIKPFHNPEVRDFIENVRRSHEQILDNVNIDSVTFAGFDAQQEANADRVIQSFRDFIEANKDEIIALRIIYSQTYKDRPMVISRLKALYEKLKTQGITIDRLWDCYAIKKPDKVRGKSTMHQLADLIAIIRFEMGYGDNLQPFAETVNFNFMRWTLKRNAGSVHFTEEQMEWLRMVKDHIAVSLSIEPDDLELSPFDHKGGLGRFYEVFGEQYEEILMEMNIELVA